MQVLSVLVKDSLPKYLKGLPIPDTVGGWFSLGIKDWMRLVPLGLAVGGISFLTLHQIACCPAFASYFESKFGECCFCVSRYKLNNSIKLDSDKVVDTVDIEDIGDKSVFCRCWKSKKFPYCDGSHNKHNKQTGDNVGPLIVSNKK
uniref:CDGSH iron-sulfur domain-containing protein 2 homologue n=1 Tax=Caligus clemensi TaxID=344056 RepID=C1C2F8_CALCM|nr:CDGSH iron sulfur domain-containing protein 2 homolog [Caligus clemensi]